MKWTDLSVDLIAYDKSMGANTVFDVKICKAVETTARRPYGCVTVTVDCDKIVVESQDGEGKTIEKRELKIDDLVCDGKADDDLASALKPLDTVRQELKEAGIGEQPNPLTHGQPEGQKAGGQEEGRGQEAAGPQGEVGQSCYPGHPGPAGPRGEAAPGG